MHTSWETRDALAQLGGFKRVLNYMKRVDEAEVSPPGRTRRPAPALTAPACRRMSLAAGRARRARLARDPARSGRARRCRPRAPPHSRRARALDNWVLSYFLLIMLVRL
jgi:hypothetical protein